MSNLLKGQSEILQSLPKNPKQLYQTIQQLAAGSYEDFENYYVAESTSKLSGDNFFSTILNNVAEGIIRINANGKIIDINDFGRSILGIDSSNKKPGNFTNYAIDYDNIQTLYVSYEKFLEKKHDKSFNITIVKGKKFLFCDIKIKKSDQYYVVFLHDITDKLKSEMALISTTQKLADAEDELKLLSMVASKTSNLVVILDPGFSVKWVNDGFTAGFGYQLDEIEGKNPVDFLNGERSGENALDELSKVKTKKTGIETELIGYHKNGDEKWIRVALNPVLDKFGKITHFVAVGTDVTKSKNDQIALINAKEKAEEASRIKAQFLSVMSHEIRTPMNAVLGMSNLLMDEKLTDRQRKYLDTLKFSSDHLLNLINDVLDFSKIEAGKIELEEIKFNLFLLINGIKESYKYKASEKGIELSIDWNENVPHFVIGDPTRLGQILNNLVGNAVKFTEKGLVELTCSLEKEDNEFVYLKFDIKDTGIGIPDQYKDSLFEQFTQSDARVNRKYGGTGLGLAITKQLVEIQGGTLMVESVEDQGSTFSISLKFGKQKEGDLAVVNGRLGNKKSLEGINILLVEDNKINQFVAGKFLEKWNSSYDIAENGDIALNALAEKEYDLILMDIQMPVKDGYETTKIIRNSEQSALREIPIIALTAENIQEIMNEAFQVGMNDFVTKPFNPDELYRKIVKNLG